MSSKQDGPQTKASATAPNQNKSKKNETSSTKLNTPVGISAARDNTSNSQVLVSSAFECTHAWYC
jgi:hypothetical protein